MNEKKRVKKEASVAFFILYALLEYIDFKYNINNKLFSFAEIYSLTMGFYFLFCIINEKLDINVKKGATKWDKSDDDEQCDT